jgi:hypothetical protein
LPEGNVSLLRLWLDDERPAPEGWTACRWPAEVIAYLERGDDVEAVSLDHDLGETGHNPRTGYDVALWLEKAIVGGWLPPEGLELLIHSANPVGVRRIEAGLRQARDLARARGRRLHVRRWGHVVMANRLADLAGEGDPASAKVVGSGLRRTP